MQAAGGQRVRSGLVEELERLEDLVFFLGGKHNLLRHLLPALLHVVPLAAARNSYLGTDPVQRESPV